MEHKAFNIVLTDEALIFLDNIPHAAADKMNYNIHRAMLGERNKEIFKKLENSEIWEFRTLYNKTAYRLFAFWGQRKRDTRYSDTWDYQKDPKDSIQGNRKCRTHKTNLF